MVKCVSCRRESTARDLCTPHLIHPRCRAARRHVINLQTRRRAVRSKSQIFVNGATLILLTADNGRNLRIQSSPGTGRYRWRARNVIPRQAHSCLLLVLLYFLIIESWSRNAMSSANSWLQSQQDLWQIKTFCLFTVCSGIPVIVAPFY